MADEPKRALVCGKEFGDEGCFVHLLTDDDLGTVRVKVEHAIARDVRLDTWIDLPPGDIRHPQVQAGIVWPF